MDAIRSNLDFSKMKMNLNYIAGPVFITALLIGEAHAQPEQAATDYLKALRGPLAEKVTFNFEDDKERRDWSNLPGRLYARNGVKFSAMNNTQQQAAHELIKASLSEQGYSKVAGVMKLDDVWADLVKGNVPIDVFELFGSGKYYMALFGTPEKSKPWGWQLDGHHLAINVTSVGGTLNLTPMFFGAEPDTVPSGPKKGWQIFSAERSKALALAESLTKSQRKQAVLANKVPDEIFEGPGAGGALKKTEGIKASELDQSQRDLLWALIDEYLNNAPKATAAAQRAKIVDDGNEQLYFAWMGAIDKAQNIYYRIHGPSVLIEYDNVYAPGRNESFSNHVHLILREPSNDFGEDLLRNHYENHDHER